MTTNPLHRRRAPLVVAATVALIGLTACGGDGDEPTSISPTGEETGAPSEGPRVVEVEMVDNAFEPSEIEVAQGETVTFELTNSGAVTHDAVIGDEAAQDQHEEEMRAAEEMDDMGHGSVDGGEEGAITVEPGETGELTHTFDAGDAELIIGCHEPGHYDAGMRIAVTVVPA